MTKKDFCLSDKLENDWWEVGVLLWAKDVKEFIEKIKERIKNLNIWYSAEDYQLALKEIDKLAGAKLTREKKEVKNGNSN